MVKPRDCRFVSKTPPRNRPPPSSGGDFSWLLPLAQLITGLLVLVLVVEMLIAFWPYLVIGLIVLLVASR